MADSPTAGDSAFELNAGRLCLDFTNTVRARPLSDKIELINDYGTYFRGPARRPS